MNTAILNEYLYATARFYHMLRLGYSTVTCAYGALHSLINLWDKKGTYFNYNKSKTEERQLLLVDKLVYGGFITAVAPFYWPLLLYKDVKRAETSLHWKDAGDFINPNLLLE